MTNYSRASRRRLVPEKTGSHAVAYRPWLLIASCSAAKADLYQPTMATGIDDKQVSCRLMRSFAGMITAWCKARRTGTVKK